MKHEIFINLACSDGYHGVCEGVVPRGFDEPHDHDCECECHDTNDLNRRSPKPNAPSI